MIQITANRIALTEAGKLLAILSVATVAPLLGNQFLSGPLVNAMLFISVMVLGFRGAVVIALIPSLVALSTGLLPPMMAPMVPFIMVGNVILIAVFDKLKGNWWPGVVSASLAKFAFLFAVSHMMAGMILNDTVATKVAAMMGWPQLATALAGGIIARLILKK